MSLSVLLGHPKKVKVKLLEGDITLEIVPMTTKELVPLLDVDEKNKTAALKATKDLVYKVLKHNFPEITPADVENMPIYNLNSILDAILDVNQLKGERSPLELRK